MRYLITILRKHVPFCLVLAYVISGGTFTHAFANENIRSRSDHERRVNFEFNRVPMSEVAAQISKQLNYKVLMDDELSRQPISGKFHDVTLDDFFSRRIFRGKNIAILFDETKHVVTISVLGNKNRLVEYDRTESVSTESMLAKYDPLELEVQPGIKRKDLKPYESEVDPMDMEVSPGITRREIRPYLSDTDPQDLEVMPGITRRDMVDSPSPQIDPEDMEVQPGVRRKDIIEVHAETDPLDMEIVPGVRRRDMLNASR